MIATFQKVILTTAALVLSTSVAFAALTLDAAKTQGLVGEEPNGLIGSVAATPSADVKALVDATNAERLKKYQDIATKNGTQVDQVEAVAGQKLLTVTPAGQYIMNASGGWQKK